MASGTIIDEEQGEPMDAVALSSVCVEDHAEVLALGSGPFLLVYHVANVARR
jgi:hypothetical protein